MRPEFLHLSDGSLNFYQILEIDEKYVFIARKSGQKYFQKTERRVVHPLVVDHEATDTAGKSRFEFRQEGLPARMGIRFFPGMQIDLYFEFRQSVRCGRVTRLSSRYGMVAEFFYQFKCNTVATVPGRGEYREKILP
jgi:hypothetical protein